MRKAKSKKESYADFLIELKSRSVLGPKRADAIEERRYFLIVCEGERTEPNYFNYFKKYLPNHLIETIQVEGQGDNTVNIVEKAVALRDGRKASVLLPDYDEVWAIYDKDDFPNDRYNDAVLLAKNQHIESGHSNPSFELWYILHFQFLQTAVHQRDCLAILSKLLRFTYRKSDLKVVASVFEKGNVKQAIVWAKSLEAKHEDSAPANSCPFTRVYVLVERLLKYTKQDG